MGLFHRLMHHPADVLGPAEEHEDIVRLEAAVGLQNAEHFLVLELIHMRGIVVHRDDFVSLSAELAHELGAEVSEADDAEFHGASDVR